MDGWTGISKDFSLTNQKSLTEDKNKWLYSSLHYYDVTGLSENNILNLNEELNMDYTDYLTNSFTYNFSDRSSSGVGARDNRLSTLLRHRLFESLISSLNAYLFREAATEFSQDSYGLSIDENYSKRLGETGRFSMGAGVSYSDERRTVPGGIISVIDEPHTLTIGIITLLGKPRDNTSTIVVTDNTGTITYVLNTDYQLGSFGDYTQILRLAGGAIADGQGVLVDYQAKSNPSLRFNTLGENFHSRIDLFSNAIGVYYRISNEAHPSIAGEENIVLQTLTDTTIGVDHNYKNLRIAVEYEHYDSSLSPYRQLRLNESFFFNPTEYSILRFESSQTAVRLGGDNKLQEFYDYLNTYSIRLNNYSQFNAEAGVRLQKGYGINLNDMVAGANFEVRLAKFQLNVRYDFKKQLYINDILINHFFSLRVKREF